MSDIQLYDATLRDGMQGPGLTLSAAEKVRVARKLDELGVHLIEAGFPSSNPKELELFELLAQERFEHADVAAFGMTRRRGVPAPEDDGLRVSSALAQRDALALLPDPTPAFGRRSLGRAMHALVLRHGFKATEVERLAGPWAGIVLPPAPGPQAARRR